MIDCDFRTNVIKVEQISKYLFVGFCEEEKEMFFDVASEDLWRHLLGKLQNEWHRLELDELAEILGKQKTDLFESSLLCHRCT